ncbi:MAG: TIGR02300 family protein [Rickettsiales bacterium]|nr:TIGR02300 family protein [Rickettsiales bacterium]|tara:strand:+ start:434 stop:727 length:294 start_codon:yes stop_codon:yes gene_type:complete
MSKKANKLGQRWTCFKCECKFYDLGSSEPLCPRCGADQREDLSAAPAAASKSSGKSKKKASTLKAAEEPEQDGDADLLDEDFDETAPEPAAEKPAGS